MPYPKRPEWTAVQLHRLEQFDIERCIDVHCHVLPGLDDGPANLSQAVALATALVEDGITTVVATPHQLGRYDRLNSADVVREGIAELQDALEAEHVPLEVLPGGDVRIDERIPRMLKSGELETTAAAGRHLLLELPHELFVDPMPTIGVLRGLELQTIMTHPERHPYLAGDVERLVEWTQEGAVIQLTAGSLLGEFGQRAFDQAWQIVRLGLAGLVATDAHDTRRRPPRLTEALASLTQEVGAKLARTLCLDNPLRVLRGETIELS